MRLVPLVLFILSLSGAFPDGERGLAGRYPSALEGRNTASGETYDPTAYTAAHRFHPFGTIVRVSRLDTGEYVDVRINDRGPYVAGRVVDLSEAAAAHLGIREGRFEDVEVTVIDRASPPPSTRPPAPALPPPPPPPAAQADDGIEEGAAMYTVQLASFSDPTRAVERARSVPNGWTQPVDVEGRTRYRVNTGIFISREMAESARVRLERRGLTGFVKELEPGWHAHGEQAR